MSISSKSRPVIIWIVTFFILSLGFYKVWQHEGIRFFGDEPHYLLMTRSLLLDHDLNLRNDYANPARYQDFYSGRLDTHLSAPKGKTSDYSIHGAGIPILMAPFMRLWGPNGAVVFMCGWAAALVLLVWQWTKRQVGSHLWSTVAVGTLVVSISFLSLVGHVFPDLVIAALLVGAGLLLTGQRCWWRYLILGVIVGVLPWIHVKTLIYAATIGVIGLWPVLRDWRRRSGWRIALWMIVPAAVLLGLYEWSLLAWYHTLLPTTAFSSSGQLFQISPLVTWGGGLFDVVKGLLVNNPAYAFIFIGLPIWWQRSPKTFWLTLALIVPTMVLQSSFGDWWGGWSPTGRYWLEFLPLLVPALAWSLAAVSHWLWRVGFFVVLAVQLKFAQIYLQAKLPWPLPGGTNIVLETLQARHHFNLTRFLPTFWGRVTPRSWLESGLATAGIMVLASLNLYLAHRSKRPADHPKNSGAKPANSSS